MVAVDVEEIGRVTEVALVGHGAAPAVAASVARAVEVAESKGNRICGLYYVESYCRQLESGRVNGTAEPEIHHDRPGAVRVDGRFGFAQPAFDAGFEIAAAAARANGVCGYSIEHTHTCTALGYFTEQFAKAGLLAIGATNATARVAPPGGSVALLGTNPMAMAVPDGAGGVAFQFDFSTSAVALGRITMAAAAGEEIPLGWAVDREGRPTTEPEAALAGSLSSAGGYKGYGLGLMVEVLAAGLTGGRRSVDVPPLKAATGPPHDLGQFYLVVDPDGFNGRGFQQTLEGLARSVAEQPGARLPGRLAAGAVTSVEVPDDLWSTIVALSR
jgi:(2R)-3-sulfolactate dehydrogenase (NADP+)